MKLANILFTRGLMSRVAPADARVTAYAAHPGIVRTPLYRHMPPPLAWAMWAGLLLVGKSAEQGAQTVLFCATDPRAVPGGCVRACAPGGRVRDGGPD